MKKFIRMFLGIMMLFVVTSWGINAVGIEEQNYKEGEEKPCQDQNCCVALSYHRIRTPNLWNKFLEKITQSLELTKYSIYSDEFEKQMKLLVDEGAYFATLEEVEQFRMTGNYPDKCIWISFDDVDATVYENAYPILKKYNIPFTLFVIAGHVGNPDFENLAMSSWEQINEMYESGLASIGSHSYDMHELEGEKANFLYERNVDEFYEDIKKSKKVIEEKIGITIDSIAYPFGDANDSCKEKIIKAGFENAFILAPYALSSNDDPYYQCRYLIDRENFYTIVMPWIKSQ